MATLYHFPSACSWVTQVALEVLGVPYEIVLVDLAAGGQRTERFLNVNERAKVPALKLGNRVLTENAAILFELNILGKNRLSSPDANEEFLQDLVWCSATLHPMVRQIRAPLRFTEGDPEGVKASGLSYFSRIADLLELRLDGRWWYGDHWSIIDCYLRWIISVASSGFDFGRYKCIEEFCNRVDGRPEHLRAREREAFAVSQGRWIK